MPVVQFNPFTSSVSPTFWKSLSQLKIDVLKLSEESVPITASYTAGRSVTDRETGVDVGLGCTLSLEGEAFQHDGSVTKGAVLAKGVLKNYNTIEEFKAADKHALFNEAADEIWSHLTKEGASDPSEALTRFLLITFADLKKYKFYYWFAFPAFVAKPSWEIVESGWESAEKQLGREGLESIRISEHTSPSAFFLVRPSSKSSSTYEVAPLVQYTTFFANIPLASRTVAFLDPSSTPQNPGWPLRNLLAYLSHLEPSTTSVNVLCWRDTEAPPSGKSYKSLYGVVTHQGGSEHTGTKPGAVGWEKNAAGKLSPRVADLAPMMDPARLADQAVDLNLKLMRWRILPSLDLERISSTKCLLLGAGTLGCFVARSLMAWGVRTITLVDYGKVSFSNPVRQPLFTFEDCLNGGKPKAECAAEALKKIFPGVNATGHTLAIPMPGHPIPPSPPSLVEQAKADVQKLETLIDEHDVVFLLMDSRESRWLPTLLGKIKGKIVINAALGFDSFLVMRHGGRSDHNNAEGSGLGCYYCNDIVAPADSMTDRTLDQMCTVTRPGLASIASSSAVELLVSLLQHPLGINAPPPPPPSQITEKDGPNPSEDPKYNSVLGLVPHQIRGSLAQFSNLLILGAAYNRCTGCSPIVMKEYEEKGFDMLLKAFNENGYLEKLTGLDKLHEEGEAAIGDFDWDEGEVEED